MINLPRSVHFVLRVPAAADLSHSAVPLVNHLAARRSATLPCSTPVFLDVIHSRTRGFFIALALGSHAAYACSFLASRLPFCLGFPALHVHPARLPFTSTRPLEWRVAGAASRHTATGQTSLRRSRNTSALISSRSTNARTSLTDRSTWCVSARLLLPLPPSFRASLRHALPPPHLLYPSSATSSLGARQSIASGSSLTLFSCPIRLLRGIDRTAITDLAFLFFAPQHFTSMLVRTLPSCLPSSRPLRAFLRARWRTHANLSLRGVFTPSVCPHANLVALGDYRTLRRHRPSSSTVRHQVP